MAHPPHFSDMPLPGRMPTVAVRIVDGSVWKRIVQQWQDYLQDRASRPQMGRPSATYVYVTDAQSLQVCTDAEQIGLRLSLDPPVVQNMRESGCCVMYFEHDGQIEVPEPSEVVGILPPRGLTVGGAREWIVRGNPEIALENFDVEAFELDAGPAGSRRGPVSIVPGADEPETAGSLQDGGADG